MTENKKRSNISSIQRKLIPSYIFLIIVSFFSVFPIYWMLTATTNSSYEISTGKIWFGSAFAKNLKSLLDQASKISGGAGFGKVMWNSFLYAAVQTLIAIVICSLAGYGFELYNDKYKDRLFSFLLLAMMIPGVATLIPLFKMISSLHLLNTVWGFILPAISTPFLIMMFRQNSRNFPVDIMEAARIDGLGELQIFYKMYMPVMKSTYAAAAVITFMNAWNAYMWPRAVLSDNKAMTMQMLVANLSNGYTVDYGQLMMGVMFCSLPTIIIFFTLQKQFAEGITGSVK